MKIADAVIHKIENSAKVEAFIGLAITTIMGLIIEGVVTEGVFDMSLVILLMIFIAVFFILQLMYYLRFIVEKWMYLKEQEQLTTMKTSEVEAECRKLDRQIELKRLERDLSNG